MPCRQRVFCFPLTFSCKKQVKYVVSIYTKDTKNHNSFSLSQNRAPLAFVFHAVRFGLETIACYACLRALIRSVTTKGDANSVQARARFDYNVDVALRLVGTSFHHEERRTTFSQPYPHAEVITCCCRHKTYVVLDLYNLDKLTQSVGPL